MLRMRYYRYYAPEVIVLELAVLLIVWIVSRISAAYYRRKSKKGPTWRCACSRAVPENEFVCICGRTKLSVLTGKKDSVPAQPSDSKVWICTCGRENPSNLSSCVCGMSKCDIPKDPPKD